jgi:TPR repeat protein
LKTAFSVLFYTFLSHHFAFAQILDIQALRNRADTGNIEAALKLAEIYALGIDAPENIDSVVWFLRPHAEKAHPEACFILGNLYLRGTGISKNITKGIGLLEKSATNGSIQAVRVLLDVYSGQDDDGPFTDPGLKAKVSNASVFRVAVMAKDWNDPYALCQLGRCYLDGIGTAINDTLALYYLEASAAWGHGIAQLVLGDVYFFAKTYKGYDALLAHKWYQLAHQNTKLSLDQRALGLEGMMWVERSFHAIRNQIIDATWMWSDWRIEFPVPDVKEKDFKRKRY